MMTMAMLPADWAKKAGSSVALREQPDSKILYEDESNYCHIIVRQSPDDSNIRSFHQDRIVHSKININDILDLQYFYAKVYAAITEELGKGKKTLSAMVIGGGGYTFPRYIEKLWPGSRIDVVEIDPGVTKAAMQAFGLEKNTTINTINMDARNYVDKLLERKRSSEKTPQYDFIYGDAFGDYCVPFQLVTRQFNEKIYAVLGDDGVYAINIIDTFDSGLFLGSVINTLEAVFPYVYAVTNGNIPYMERNFVIIAAKHQLDLKNIISRHRQNLPQIYYPTDSDIDKLKQKNRHLVLTDNYCPAENLLAPVARDNIKVISAKTIFERAEKLKQAGQFSESIENYRTAAKIYPYPVLTVPAYRQIGHIYAQMGRLKQAAEAFEKAIQYNDHAQDKTDIINIRYKLGVILKELGKPEQAAGHFQKIIEELRTELVKRPDYDEGWQHLGDTFAEMGNFAAASDAFSKAVAINPDEPVYYNKLVKALEFQARYSEAIEVLKKQILLMKDRKQDNAVLQLQKHLESLEYRNSTGKRSD
jgi:tetratricopeptide (TPR) repeat protein